MKELEISLAAEKVGHIGAFPITNTLIMSLASVAVLVVLALVLKRKVRLIPRGVQNVFEALVEGAFSIMDGVTGSRAQSVKFFPLVFTLFLFILTSNWMGLLPGIGSIGIHEEVHGKEVLVPLFRSTNADLNVTLALAIIAVISIQIFGILAVSAKKYGRKFFNFKNPIYTFVGIVELIGEFAKFISFSFRLFGNVFAGEILLTVIAFLIPVIAPLPFMFLEIFVGAVQAFIFAILTLVFLKVATTAEEH